MHLSTRARRRLAAGATALGVGAAGLMVAMPQQASAASNTCKTVKLSMWNLSVNADLSVPICYNGTYVWQNGHITPGAGMIGGGVDITWYGSYHDSGLKWLGVGENLHVSGAFWSDTCQPRWYINGHGGVYGGTFPCN